MPLKTPDFWYRDAASSPPLIEKMMQPLSLIYQFGSQLNLNRTDTKRVPIPVICVGNVTAGGSGKTPSIIALHKLIKTYDIFKNPYFLSRGYGGHNKNARLITVHDGAGEAGDEPLMLAKHSNTVISVNRYDGAKMLHDLGADLILMDDGFQNQTLFKDLSFLVIDGKTGFGNGKLLPAGPLREPAYDAFKRAHAVILIGEDHRNLQTLIPENLPVFKAKIAPVDLDKINLSIDYIAFAGLAHPKKFKNTLQENNINLLSFHAFADHHPYSEKEITRLMRKARTQNARLITTEKDYQRIPAQYHMEIDYLPIELVWAHEDDVVNFLKGVFQ